MMSAFTLAQMSSEQSRSIADDIAMLPPSYFALVMATGIVSLACDQFGMQLLARQLFWMNIVFYVVLWILNVIRAVRFRARVAFDLLHHGRAVGFFTAVAATCVFGLQLLVIVGSHRLASVLWTCGIVLWAVITYGVFALLTVNPHKPPISEGLNGSWLVSVVAAQSVSVLGTQLVVSSDVPGSSLLLLSLLLWLGGGMLYIWIISLIFYRYTFIEMHPADLSPPYWINMGAVAISALAGVTLLLAAPAFPLIGTLRPFVLGLTLLFWSTATWWIPMLLILEVWRHIYSRFPLRYDPLDWGAVFPLGMYSVCTFQLARVIGQPFLVTVARAFLVIALVAWAATMIGLARRVLRGATVPALRLFLQSTAGGPKKS